MRGNAVTSRTGSYRSVSGITGPYRAVGVASADRTRCAGLGEGAPAGRRARRPVTACASSAPLVRYATEPLPACVFRSVRTREAKKPTVVRAGRPRL
jgi:hypothetical protein